MSWSVRALCSFVCLVAMGWLLTVPVASGRPALRVPQARERGCRVASTERLRPYPWPLKPFHRQHPVRGYFGDPRAVVYASRLGLFAFHNGIDISAWTGNAVYPVVSGVVVRTGSDEVVVGSSSARRFQYIHVIPRVRVGEQVIASRTILGNVARRWDHVHLTEVRGGCVVNPLAPGHLAPYRDLTVPTVRGISFSRPTGARLSPRRLHGFVEAVAQAEDTPSLPGPGIWRRMPVAPALLRWSISTSTGRRVAGGTSVDFRLTEPPPQDFCRVYAPGTTQNFAADAGHYRWGHAGRYLYRLTPTAFDTATLANGRYRLAVTASDTAGNSGTRTVVIRIENSKAPADPPRPSRDWRCAPRALSDARVRAFRDLRRDLSHHVLNRPRRRPSTQVECLEELKAEMSRGSTRRQPCRSRLEPERDRRTMAPIR
jgi:hypothetical protein